ncbi:hypothetical protein BDR05DRAFT_947115 [Suillus weaverae]|nr:hypothetical protein BDR05DRAFT_947115 [Suillus weaverae]
MIYKHPYYLIWPLIDDLGTRTPCLCSLSVVGSYLNVDYSSLDGLLSRTCTTQTRDGRGQAGNLAAPGSAVLDTPAHWSKNVTMQVREADKFENFSDRIRYTKFEDTRSHAATSSNERKLNYVYQTKTKTTKDWTVHELGIIGVQGEEIREAEVDLSSFLARQRLSDVSETTVAAAPRVDNDDIDHELAHISSHRIPPPTSQKGRVQAIEWDAELEEMSREKAAADASRGDFN